LPSIWRKRAFQIPYVDPQIGAIRSFADYSTSSATYYREGRRPSIEAAKAALASLADQFPVLLIDSLQDQLSRLSTLAAQRHKHPVQIQCAGPLAPRRFGAMSESNGDVVAPERIAS
jgi:hypothetical protein